MNDDWKAAWQPVIDRVGEDVGSPGVQFGPDPVEAGAIRKYCEPLEFDCALHHDAQVARSYGYPDVVAPYTALASFTMPALWQPGRETFTDADRDAQPSGQAVKPVFPAGTPPVTGYFATEVDIDFLRPVRVGERLGRRGGRLVGCEPKETKVGRGAFVKFEADVVTDAGEVVARIYSGLYLYNPHTGADT